jgi:hypothetical protein
MDCLFCGQELAPIGEHELPARERVAFDAVLGRLWQVCPACRRWNAVPFEDRWPILELCERTAASGRVLLQSEHLVLLQARSRQLIRVDRPPRVELSVWRYSRLTDPFSRSGGLVGSILRLPERPVGGVIGADYHGGVVTVPPAWIASPFLEHGGLLTLLFSSVPLAPECPSCGLPFALEPAAFADVRLVWERAGPAVVADCALCRQTGTVPLTAARPALRTALAVVSRRHRSVHRVKSGVEPLDRTGSGEAFIARLAKRDAVLGSLTPRLRLSLWLGLDEWAEAESLEAEWRTAEALASIADDELTEVAGFDEFRRRVMGQFHQT